MTTIKIHIFSSLVFFILQPALVILLCIAFFKKNMEMSKIILSSLLLVNVALLMSYFTGETTKNLISNFPAVTDEVLDPHEKAAQILIYGSGLLFLLNVLAFKFIGNKIFVRVFSVILCFATLYQAHVSVLGMKIRHTEIRNQLQNFNVDED